jgi:hypothetical protein
MKKKGHKITSLQKSGGGGVKITQNGFFILGGIVFNFLFRKKLFLNFYFGKLCFQGLFSLAN